METSILSSTTLATAMAGAGYLCLLCAIPPTSSDPKSRETNDRISFIAGFARIGGIIGLIEILYHTTLTLLPSIAPELAPTICPRPENRNQALFTWSISSIFCLLLIYIAAWIRLSAYKGLGQSFTFYLQSPDKLVTSGIYRYIQHPSYTGLALLVTGLCGLFSRADATAACWVEQSTLSWLLGWTPAFVGGGISLGIWFLATRIRDEEEMLKRRFGRDWEVWHRATSRLVPWIF